jgi:hypothetical protein
MTARYCYTNVTINIPDVFNSDNYALTGFSINYDNNVTVEQVMSNKHAHEFVSRGNLLISGTITVKTDTGQTPINWQDYFNGDKNLNLNIPSDETLPSGENAFANPGKYMKTIKGFYVNRLGESVAAGSAYEQTVEFFAIKNAPWIETLSSLGTAI